MTELDLFVMARENAEHLASECAGHTGAVVELAESVTREGRFSVTMRFKRLHAFLKDGRYLNPWEECARDAKGDEKKATRLMVRRQKKKWYGKRALFDGSFIHGKKFRYGALHTGGRALIPSWGPFCAVFSLVAARSWKLIAWLPANSIPSYVPDDHTLNLEKLKREVGAHESRHHVAAIKHAGDVASWPRDEWSVRLCCETCFVEGIVVDDLLPQQVEHFLAESDSWEEILRANLAHVAGTASTEQVAKAKQHRTLTALMKAQNIKITWEPV